VIRHAGPVKVRRPGAPDGYALTFYDKRARLDPGGALIVGADGRAELLWAGEATSIVLFDRGVAARAAVSALSYKAATAMSSLSYWTIGGAFLLASGRVPRPLAIIVLAIPAVLLVSVVFFVRGLSGDVFASLRRLFARFRLLAPLDRLLARYERPLAEVDRLFRELREQRAVALLGAVLIETAVRVLLASELYIILRSIGRPVEFTDVLAMDAAANLVVNASFFIPFELGAREGGLYVILGAFGLTGGIGIFVAVVNRARELFWIGVAFTWAHFLVPTPRGIAPSSTPLASE
jgi:hypothetical protein